jgi:hypothetical protein
MNGTDWGSGQAADSVLAIRMLPPVISVLLIAEFCTTSFFSVLYSYNIACIMFDLERGT